MPPTTAVPQQAGAPADQAPGDFRWSGGFWRAMVAFFLVLTGHQFLLLYPLRLQQLGKDETQIGLLMGVSALAAVLARPTLGDLIDRRGRRGYIIVGSAAMALILLLYLVPTASMAFLLPVRLAHGIAFAASFTAFFTWAADVAPKERLAECIGLFGIAGLLSGGAGAWLAEWILGLSGGAFSACFVTASALVIGGAVVALPLPETTPHAAPRASFWTLVGRGDLVGVTLASAAFGFGSGTLGGFFAPHGLGSGLDSVATFFVVYSVAAALVRLLCGHLTDRVGRSRVIAPSLLSFAAGIYLLTVPGWPAAVLPIAVLFGLAHGIVYPALNATMVERAVEQRGAANALFGGAVDLGYFAGPSLLGSVARAHGFDVMFRACFLVMVGSTILFWLLEARARTRPPEP